jgi:hypothetical protein
LASGGPGPLKINHLLVRKFGALGCFFGPGEVAMELNR